MLSSDRNQSVYTFPSIIFNLARRRDLKEERAQKDRDNITIEKVLLIITDTIFKP
jgi:hypothetical protein